MGGGGDLTYQLDILLVFGEYRRKETLKLVSEFKAKRIILPFSLRTLFKKNYDNVFYHQWHKHREVWRSVQLVRHINKKHFDENVLKLDLHKFKLFTLKEHKDYVDSFFVQHKAYKFIVGVNAFGNTLYKFSPQDFVDLARNLAQKHPSVLFVMMSFKANTIAFKPFAEKNLIIFENNGDIMNLVEFTSRLDMLISPDTGNVHIADICKVPILECMQKKVRLKWGGGSWHNECKILGFNSCFIKKYTILKDKFAKMADEMIIKLTRQKF